RREKNMASPYPRLGRSRPPGRPDGKQVPREQAVQPGQGTWPAGSAAGDPKPNPARSPTATRNVNKRKLVHRATRAVPSQYARSGWKCDSAIDRVVPDTLTCLIQGRWRPDMAAPFAGRSTRAGGFP